MANKFGVDGLVDLAVETIADLNDGMSGLNGPSWNSADNNGPGGAPGGGYNSIQSIADKRTLLDANGRQFQMNLEPYHDVAVINDDDGNLLYCDDAYLGDWDNMVSYLLSNVDIDCLQIDSEPYSAPPHWNRTSEGAAGYAEMMQRAHAIAHSSIGGNAGTKTMMAGFNFGNRFLFSSDVETDAQVWTRQVIEDVSGGFDILSLHLNHSYAGLKRTIAWVRSVLDATQTNRGKPIWADDAASGPFYEAPWATAEELDYVADLFANDPATVLDYATRQAKYLIKKHAVAFSCGVERIMTSADVNLAFTYPDEHWRYQGLLINGDNPVPWPAGTKKPAYYTYKMEIEELDGFATCQELKAVGRQSEPPGELSGQAAYRFTFPMRGGTARTPVVVAWMEGGDSSFMDLSRVFRGNKVRVKTPVTALDANLAPVEVEEFTCQACRVPLTDTPVFLSIA